MSDMQTLYFDINYALRTHDMILRQSGGLKGIRDIGQLESVLSHIQNDDYYGSFEDKLTHLVFCITKFHAFTDGNKRSAIGLGAFFLELNGYDYCTKQFIRTMEIVVVAIAENRVDKSFLFTILCEIINEERLNEELQLILIDLAGQDNDE